MARGERELHRNIKPGGNYVIQTWTQRQKHDDVFSEICISFYIKPLSNWYIGWWSHRFHIILQRPPQDFGQKQFYTKRWYQSFGTFTVENAADKYLGITTKLGVRQRKKFTSGLWSRYTKAPTPTPRFLKFRLLHKSSICINPLKTKRICFI
jgi:hypothetical protein